MSECSRSTVARPWLLTHVAPTTDVARISVHRGVELTPVDLHSPAGRLHAAGNVMGDLNHGRMLAHSRWADVDRLVATAPDVAGSVGRAVNGFRCYVEEMARYLRSV